ncbi:DUF1206 domain-containing protein [Cryobacterium melibiosiphilum]|uniref:DUF1206 domain-containing protein n=1 Tax=Cryobacterium melibiosiphilum TaxID=995039 RepID=A0A3A5MHP9_9MICO|nr:DUF1206 domain-containing protein [Cryobacterium melibiosiphilum]
MQALARLGYAVNGLLHILIAGIAIAVALGGSGGESADQSGALGQLASSPGGVFVLWTVVVGLAALGLWLLLSAFLLKGGDPKKKWSHRASEIGKAVVYFLLAATASTFASGGSTSSSASASDASAQLLAAPGGVVLLVVVGLGVLAIAVYFVQKGARQKFTEDISVPGGTTGRAIIALGVVGYVAKGIALAVVGVLVVIAAVTLDPSKSSGLDGALKSLIALPYGGLVLGTISVGLMAYGGYCFARAWRARL